MFEDVLFVRSTRGMMPTTRAQVVHRVEGGHFLDLIHGDAQNVGDVLHGIAADPTHLVLCHVQRGQESRTRIWILVGKGANTRHGIRGKYSHVIYLSISPRTISIDPMMAMMSATRRPFDIWGKACRL